VTSVDFLTVGVFLESHEEESNVSGVYSLFHHVGLFENNTVI